MVRGNSLEGAHCPNGKQDLRTNAKSLWTMDNPTQFASVGSTLISLLVKKLP
jgi:hypothetical protein